MSERVHNRRRELRQENGLTQEQLAKAEVGRYVPSIELALRIAASSETPLETIFWLPPEERAALTTAALRRAGKQMSGRAKTSEQVGHEQ